MRNKNPFRTDNFKVEFLYWEDVGKVVRIWNDKVFGCVFDFSIRYTPLQKSKQHANTFLKHASIKRRLTTHKQ